MHLPKVSVVMPVYNGEKYLREAIESVLYQTYKNIELVIVNDGSSDSSKSIILSYKDPRISYVENKINSGIVYTRNKGLESAKGEYIATLDCDDIAFPDRIEKQVYFLEKNTDYGMCGSFYYTMDGNGKSVKKIRMPTGNRDILTYLMVGNCFCNSTVMIRSEIARELRYKANYYLAEDYELWLRISEQTKLAILPFYGTYYRVHGSNITVSKMDDMFFLVKKLHAEILTNAHIDFSEKELEIHANWINGNYLFFNEKHSLSTLSAWIYKFYSEITRGGKVNKSFFFKLISEKWLYILFKTKNYKQLFHNKFFFLNRTIYLRELFRKFSNKLTVIK
jgi:glycosyltransferase involved in cell wall biosynthesis